jgi:4-coumarate--CoA ligase
VAPAEIEGILISHPFVNEGVVCAKWDENQGTEVPMAYVTLTKAGQSHASGVEAVLGVIREFIDGKVSPYKRLRGGVEILDEIPKTASGKILRRLLPARLARERKSKLWYCLGREIGNKFPIERRPPKGFEVSDNE